MFITVIRSYLRYIGILSNFPIYTVVVKLKKNWNHILLTIVINLLKVRSQEDKETLPPKKSDFRSGERTRLVIRGKKRPPTSILLGSLHTGS